MIRFLFFIFLIAAAFALVFYYFIPNMKFLVKSVDKETKEKEKRLDDKLSGVDKKK